MKFTVAGSGSGTSLMGEVYTDYDTLVKLFGLPQYGPNNKSGDGKVTCEWTLRFEDGTVATIYDWKEGKTPKSGYSWLIGGKYHQAVDRVLEVLDYNKPLVEEVEVKEPTNVTWADLARMIQDMPKARQQDTATFFHRGNEEILPIEVLDVIEEVDQNGYTTDVLDDGHYVMSHPY